MRTRARGAVCALLLAALLASPGGPGARLDAAPRTLSARVRGAVHRHAEGVRVSLAVWDLERGSRLASLNPEIARRTASVMKLATTGAALLSLGPGHEIETEVYARARPRDGVVRGDLIVRGGGDPGFSAHFSDGGAGAAVRQLARRVKSSGVRRVEGDLVLDTSLFASPDRHPDWGWRDGAWDWWSAPVTALTLNDACVDVRVLPGARVGAPARLQVTPPTSLVQFANRLVTVADKKKHTIAFAGRDGERRVIARGRVWKGSTGYEKPLACIDPPRFFGDVLRRSLSEVGVEVVGRTRVVRDLPHLPPRRRPHESARVVLGRHATTVARVVGVTNKRSQNLYAELLLRLQGVELEGLGSFEAGAAAVRRTLGFATADRGFTQVDGSGLSRRNRATPEAIGHVLRVLYESEQRLVFMSSLAAAGEEGGTLDGRLTAERFRGRVLAKTGTLRDTSALAGYVRLPDERVLAFAILCEGQVHAAKVLQEAVVAALFER